MLTAGGSVANTAIAMSSLGSRIAFIGKIAHDCDGLFFKNDINSHGVDNFLELSGNHLPTSASIIYLSKDGKRTMVTYLGISQELRLEDIPFDNLLNTRMVLLESYLLDIPGAKSLLSAINAQVKQSGISITLSLSDKDCVIRHHDFIHSILTSVDIVFGNKLEFKALFNSKSESDLDTYALEQDCLNVITCGVQGCVVYCNKRKITCPVSSVGLIDINCASDIFAAGFLHGYLNDKDLKMCAQYANNAVVSAFKYSGKESFKRLVQEKEAV